MARSAVLLAIVVAAGGCAALGLTRGDGKGPSAGDALADAIAAHERGDSRGAAARLERLGTGTAGAPIDRRALLTAAAIELDPRNPERRPQRAARYADAARLAPATDAWTESIAETLYLLALELGAEPPIGDGRPTLPGRSLAERLDRAEQLRDSLRLRNDTLEHALDAARMQIAAQASEIDRLRKLLEP